MPLPDALTTTVLSGTYTAPDGTPLGGYLTFTPSSALTNGSGHPVLAATQLTARLQPGTGAFSISLLNTDNDGLLPDTWMWHVAVSVPGAQESYFFGLPSTLGDATDINTLTPVSPPPSGASFVASINGQTGDVVLADGFGILPPAGDLGGGTTLAPHVTATHLADPLPVVQGGTGAATGAAALTALGGISSASPALTGTPTAPTASALTSTTQIATTAYADSAVGVEASRANTAEGLKLAKASNLSDVANAATARGNLGAQGVRTPTAVKTGTSYTAVAGDFARIDSTAGAYTVTLPAAPADKTVIGVKLVASATPVNAVTIARGGSDTFNVSGGTTLTLKLLNQGVLLQYDTAATAWDVHSDDLPLGGLDARYTGRPLAAEATYFVSSASYASDSNDGLTLPTAKATIAGALTALGSGGGVVQLGAGAFTISTADSSGNAVTLGSAGTVLRGLGRNTTRIVLGGSVSVTWGILAQKALCEVQDIGLQVPSGTTCTYGMGVDTPASTGSAENCKFTRCLVQGTGGTLANGYAIAQAFSGAGVDIAGTAFNSCRAATYVNAGYLLGNAGTTGNVLDTDLWNCSAQAGAFGLLATDTNFHWVGGTIGENTTSDFKVSASTSAASVVQGVRSENSARLLQSTSAGTNSLVSLRDVTWTTQSADIAAAGDVINHAMSGSLVLDNVAITGTGTVTPVIILAGGPSGRLTVTANGLQASQPLHQLFSATPSQNVQVVATNYTQLSSTGGTPVVATVPGPLSLFGTATTFSFNGSSRDVMSPVETQTLASSGAVTINGTANYAKITLQANATSSSVANLYPGQRLAISWVQDATGGRTYAWPAICKFAGGVTPTASTAASAVDTATFYYDGTSLIQDGPVPAVSVIDGVAVSGAAVSGNVITATSATTANWQTPAGGVTLDTTASDVQPDGTQAAGGTGKAADAGHVHPGGAYNSLWVAPAGAKAETFPRWAVANSNSTALTSGTLYVCAIPVAVGQVISNITMMTANTAKTGGTHGWYVLLDSGLVVRAVTADQTDAATVWGAAKTAYTLAVGTPYTTTYSGLYYAGVMVAETSGTMPLFAVAATQLSSSVDQIAPVYSGSSSTGQTTPPATGTTMGALAGLSGYSFYSYLT